MKWLCANVYSLQSDTSNIARHLLSGLFGISGWPWSHKLLCCSNCKSLSWACSSATSGISCNLETLPDSDATSVVWPVDGAPVIWRKHLHIKRNTPTCRFWWCFAVVRLFSPCMYIEKFAYFSLKLHGSHTWYTYRQKEMKVSLMYGTCKTFITIFSVFKWCVTSWPHGGETRMFEDLALELRVSLSSSLFICFDDYESHVKARLSGLSAIGIYMRFWKYFGKRSHRQPCFWGECWFLEFTKA